MSFMDDVSGFFGYKDPSGKANQTIGRIPQEAGQYTNHFYNAGVNPEQIYNKWMSNYEQTPEYKDERDQALLAADNAAAAGGYAGTNQHQRYAQEISQGIGNKYRDKYMDRMMGLHNTGFNAGTGLQNLNAQTLAQRANYEYGGRQGQNMANAQLIQSIIELLTTGAFSNKKDAAGKAIAAGAAGGA